MDGFAHVARDSVSHAAHLWSRGHTCFLTALTTSLLVMAASAAPTVGNAQAGRDDLASAPRTRSVEMAATLGGGASDRAGAAIELAVDLFVPRYWVGVRALVGSNFAACMLDCGFGHRESFHLVAVGATTQIALHRNTVSATLFAGPSFGTLNLDWYDGAEIFGGCENGCTPAPTTKPRIGNYVVVGALASAALSFHAAAFMVGASCDLSILAVDGVAYVSATIGPRIGASF